MWRNWNPHTLLVGKGNAVATSEKYEELLKKLTELLYDSTIPLLGIHSREMKTDIHAKIYT